MNEETFSLYNPRDRKNLLILFLVALVIRGLFLTAVMNRFDSLAALAIAPDCAKYLNVASHMTGYETAGEDNLFLVGPGYPFFLFLIFRIFGIGAWPVMIIQLILSSLSCCLIYASAATLIPKRSVALIAGFISALSLTSISLSAVLLTETLFFFIFVLTLFLFLHGLPSSGKKYPLLIGILAGLAVLVRSVTQLFWIVFILIALIYPLGQKVLSRRTIIKKAVISAAIMLLIMGIWGIRNYARHGIFTISDTGLGAARIYLVPRVINDSRPGQDFWAIRGDLEKVRMIGDRPQTIEERHHESIRILVDTFRNHPTRFIRTYFKIVWENISSGGIIHDSQLPQFKNLFGYYEKITTINERNGLGIVLTVAGALILVVRRSIRIAAILLLIILYFALLGGVTCWQGSRVFFPAQAAYSVLIGVALSTIWTTAAAGLHRIGRTLNKKPARI